MFLSGTDFWRYLDKAYSSVPGSGGSIPLHAIPCLHGLTIHACASCKVQLPHACAASRCRSPLSIDEECTCNAQQSRASHKLDGARPPRIPYPIPHGPPNPQATHMPLVSFMSLLALTFAEGAVPAGRMIVVASASIIPWPCPPAAHLVE
jgi:hypothetical protein